MGYAMISIIQTKRINHDIEINGQDMPALRAFDEI